VEEISRRAGRAILEIYERVDPEVTYKDDASPLTAADLASHEILAAGLAELAPGIPLLSEEGASLPWEERRGWPRFWLVDPLDGTKEFVKRNGEFTVNVALIEGGVPVLGVVHCPTLGRTYLGARGAGARRRDGDGEARAIRASGSGAEELVVVASRSHAGPELAAFLAALPVHRLVSMGSSLKLCLVAEGSADFYPRLAPTMEWDTAAAHAVVLEAGGRVFDTAGVALEYNKESLRNPHFLVAGERPVPWKAALRPREP
jgi:3'(2'), 5'-bisphosphate nucleotidase